MLMLNTYLYRTSNQLLPTPAESVASPSPHADSCAKLWPYLCHRCEVSFGPPSPLPQVMTVLICYYSLLLTWYICNFVLDKTCKTYHCCILPSLAYLRRMPVFCFYGYVRPSNVGQFETVHLTFPCSQFNFLHQTCSCWAYLWPQNSWWTRHATWHHAKLTWGPPI
jgi:hypothetical protein